MRIIPVAAALVVLGSVAFAGAARGADRPLLVAVEVGPGVDVAPTDVRRAVAAELGSAVVGAYEPTGDGAADVLLVALGPREIRMSLRAGTAPVVSRTIAVPPDRTGRLRSIGWLAGNLVRDQVGPIVATREPPSLEAVVAAEPPALAAADPSPPALSAPQVSPAPAPVSAAPAAVASSPAPIAPAATQHAVWSITAIGGPVVTVTRDTTTSVTRGDAFQLELQRQRSPDSMLLGIAVTAGPAAPRHYVGAAAFAGQAWRGQSWFAEATLGLGVEALDGYAWIKWSAGTAPTSSNPSVATDMSESRVSTGPVPGLYLRAAGTGGLSVSRFFDLVAQLGAHVSSEGDIGSYLGATAGVRLRLP
jgi:hypothetical protein